MKRLLCLCLALLAALMFALPAAGVPYDPYEPDDTEYYDYDDAYDPDDEPETTEPLTTTTVFATAPPEAIFGEEEPDLAPLLPPACVLEDMQFIATYAALGVAVLALILSIIALAKSRKNKSNAAGNYKKFF